MSDRPLKILLTDPHLRGGGQVRYLTNLARELVCLGHHVVIGCKPDSVLVDSAQEAGCPHLNKFSFRGGLRPRSWAHDLHEARRFIRTQSPDVLHANGSQDHWVSALGNWTMGRPVCVVRTRHNTYPVSDHLPNRTLNRQWTDYQIVVCDVVREQLAEQAAFDGARMCSIHNGVDADRFRPDPAARHKARAEFGYTDKHIVCGIAARLVPAKGHEFLFQAAGMLAKDFPQLRVLVLGQGDLEPELRQMALERCGEQTVRFAGFRQDMEHCIQAVDIGVQPSIDCDTSSFSLKEQMAAEKPVIASDYGGLPEIITDGVEGLVVPAGSVEPLAAAIRRLIESPSMRDTLGRAGRTRVLKDFIVQVFAARTVEAYRRAIEIHRERTAH